jgi:domain of unknown function (DUF1834)|nr:MAG TPA: protein of unknown function (DUF1834) [Caudoviricetes sp.]
MIGTVEQKIVDFLKSANDSKALGYKVEKISSYKGEFNYIQELLGNCRSAILVAFAGKSLKRQLQGMRIYDARYLVEVYSRNATRNEADSRMGPAAAYQMAEDVEALLNGNNLGVLSEALELQRMDPVMNSKINSYHVGALELEFSCAIKVKAADDEDYQGLHPFKILATTWDLPEPADHTLINLPQPEEQKADE